MPEPPEAALAGRCAAPALRKTRISRVRVLLAALVLCVAPALAQPAQGGLRQQLPPALLNAQERAHAASQGTGPGLASGAGVKQPLAVPRLRRDAPLQPGRGVSRSLLAELQAAAPAPEAAAAAASADAPEPSPWANLTVGTPGVTGARESALRSALLDGYDASIYPWAEFGPAPVNISVSLHKILNVDLYGGTLKMAVWLRTIWFDPRLVWDREAWNVTRLTFANPQPGETELWNPDIVLWNAATPILNTLGQEPLAADGSGRVFWSRPGVFEVACNFRGLSAFPFGRVRCQLELGSWVYGPWYVDVQPDGANGWALGGSVTSSESAVWTEYRFADVKAWRHTYPPYPCCPDESDWPVLLIEVALERQNLIYLMKVIVPQIILTAVAFTTFWLSPACGERLGLAVTVPLAVAVYDLLTFSQLPVSNKVTLVSAMGMTAFLFSMAVLVENAIVIQLWFYREHEYFRGLSVLAATALAYREQLVWVGVLGVIKELKTELVRRHLAVLSKGKRSRSMDAGDLFYSVSNMLDITGANKSRVLLVPAAMPDNSGRGVLLTPRSRTSLNGADCVRLSPGDSDQAVSPPAKQQAQQQQLVRQQHLIGVPLQGMSSRLRARARWRHAVRHVLAEAREQQQHAELQQQLDRSCAQAQLPRAPSSVVRGVPSPGSFAAGSSPQPARGMFGGLRIRSRVKARVMDDLQDVEARFELPQTEGLLLATSKEQLRGHLNAILASPDPRLAHMQRRISKAVAVFGEEPLVARLHHTLMGGEGDGSGPRHQHSQGGKHVHGLDGDSEGDEGELQARSHKLHERLSDDFNRRWQLLSMMVDYVSRWAFILGYVLCMVLLSVILIGNAE